MCVDMCKGMYIDMYGHDDVRSVRPKISNNRSSSFCLVMDDSKGAPFQVNVLM